MAVRVIIQEIEEKRGNGCGWTILIVIAIALFSGPSDDKGKNSSKDSPATFARSTEKAESPPNRDREIDEAQSEVRLAENLLNETIESIKRLPLGNQKLPHNLNKIQYCERELKSARAKLQKLQEMKQFGR
jgi:hypothetical protein